MSKHNDRFEELGIRIVALVYESPDILDAFSRRYAISYTLLSDPESEVIRQYGLLNTAADPGSKYYGIPYPGAFLADAEGIIVRKFAEENYQDRPLVTDLLDAAESLAGQ